MMANELWPYYVQCFCNRDVHVQHRYHRLDVTTTGQDGLSHALLQQVTIKTGARAQTAGDFVLRRYSNQRSSAGSLTARCGQGN